MEKSTKYTLIGITVWMVLQLPRFIAIPLINDVLSDSESQAWLYPAILDCVVAGFTPIMILLLWTKKKHFTWVLAIVYFAVSITDHGGSITADFITTTPKVFGGETGTSPLVASGSQAIIDIICIFLLAKKSIKSHFFQLQNQ